MFKRNIFSFLLIASLLSLGQAQSEITTNKFDVGQQLLAEIEDAIKTRNFTVADEKIIGSGQDFGHLMTTLVSKIYAGNVENFKLLCNYGRASQVTKINFAILTELWNEMVINSHTKSIDRLMAIHKAFNEKIMNNCNATDDMTENSQLSMNEIGNEIIENSAKRMETALLVHKYVGNSEIRTLNRKLLDFGEYILDETLELVIQDIGYDQFGKFRDQIVRNLFEMNQISQQATILIEICRDLIEGGDEKNADALPVAQLVSQLMRSAGYSKISDEKRDSLENFMKSLSGSVKHLYSSEVICFRNVFYGEYIHASSLARGPNQRYSFTSTNKTIRDGSQFHPKSIGRSKFEFENVKYPNQYLYSPELNSVADRFIPVYIGANLGYSAAWNIILYRNRAFILNVGYNEYLCLSSEMYSENERFVITKVNGFFVDQCEWIVEKC